MTIAEYRKNDLVHGPRRTLKIGPYTFCYDCLDDSEPDNARFIYRVSFYKSETDYWRAFYREAIGGYELVGFDHGAPSAFISMGEAGRNVIAAHCVP